MTPSPSPHEAGPHPTPTHSRALHVLLTITTGCAAAVLALYVLRPNALREGNPGWTDWLALVTVGLLPLQYWLLWAPVSLHARWKAGQLANGYLSDEQHYPTRQAKKCQRNLSFSVSASTGLQSRLQSPA